MNNISQQFDLFKVCSWTQIPAEELKQKLNIDPNNPQNNPIHKKTTTNDQMNVNFQQSEKQDKMEDEVPNCVENDKSQSQIPYEIPSCKEVVDSISIKEECMMIENIDDVIDYDIAEVELMQVEREELDKIMRLRKTSDEQNEWEYYESKFEEKLKSKHSFQVPREQIRY